MGHSMAEIPGTVDDIRSIANKALGALPEILQLLPEIIGSLQELPRETSCSP